MGILIEAKSEFLDGASIGYSEGSIDVGAACDSFGDDALGGRTTISVRFLWCLEYFESPEQMSLLFLAEKAVQSLQALAIIIIVSHLTVVLRFLLEQH